MMADGDEGAMAHGLAWLSMASLARLLHLLIKERTVLVFLGGSHGANTQKCFSFLPPIWSFGRCLISCPLYLCLYKPVSTMSKYHLLIVLHVKRYGEQNGLHRVSS